ncbi:MAG: hypothetical protein SR1Q7_07350 [Quinella sp. 1Q7]|nr:hypothetical protein [Quinella sp. 1Q7]
MAGIFLRTGQRLRLCGGKFLRTGQRLRFCGRKFCGEQVDGSDYAAKIFLAYMSKAPIMRRKFFGGQVDGSDYAAENFLRTGQRLRLCGRKFFLTGSRLNALQSVRKIFGGCSHEPTGIFETVLDAHDWRTCNDG